MFTTLYINYSDVQGQITLVLAVVSGRNLNSSKLSCMSSLPARMRLIKSKMKNVHKISTIIRQWGFFQTLVRDVIDVLVTCKYEKDPIKNKGGRVFTTLYINFSDAQG